MGSYLKRIGEQNKYVIILVLFLARDIKKVREKSRECNNHDPQLIPDTKWKRKQTKPNKRK